MLLSKGLKFIFVVYGLLVPPGVTPPGGGSVRNAGDPGQSVMKNTRRGAAAERGCEARLVGEAAIRARSRS